MKWLSNRISVKKHGLFTTIIITPLQNFWVNLLMGAWLGMWLTIGVVVISSFFIFDLSYQEELILWIFLSFWGYYLQKISRSFIWLLYGKELIKIDEVGLNYKRSIFKYGKTHVIFFENILSITSRFPEEKSLESVWESSPWINAGERIFLETKLKTYSLGRKLTKTEASGLIDLLKTSVKRAKSND
jgi:hypothetical protein